MIYKVRAKFKKETDKLFRIMMKFVKRNVAISPVMEFIGVVLGVLFLIMGGKEVLSGQMTKGEFLLFIVAILSLLHPFRKIGKSVTMLQQAMAGFIRIFDFLSIKTSITEPQNPRHLNAINSNIVFKNIACGLCFFNK